MIPTILELAKVGAHFGHRRALTFPKAKRFVYATQQNVSLIDLEKTIDQLRAAKAFWEDYKKSGRPALLVGTKRSLRTIIKSLADQYGIAYVNERWYGGFLTNFDNFLKEIERYRQRAADIELGEGVSVKKISKATRQRLINRLAKNDRFLGGVKDLKSKPELLIVASGSQDHLALKEAARMGVPIIALADTDVNPDLITFPIPANDDAPKAVEMILGALFAPEAIQSVSKKVKSKSDLSTLSKAKTIRASSEKVGSTKSSAKKENRSTLSVTKKKTVARKPVASKIE